MEGQPGLPCPLHPHPKPWFWAALGCWRYWGHWDRAGAELCPPGEGLWHPAVPWRTVAVMSRVLPHRQLRDRELGPARAALPARTPGLHDQADGTPGRHCAGRLVPLPQEEHSTARPTSRPGTWPYWFYFQQEEQGCHLLAAQLHAAAGTLPPAACRSQGQCPCPRWVAWAGRKCE